MSLDRAGSAGPSRNAAGAASHPASSPVMPNNPLITDQRLQMACRKVGARVEPETMPQISALRCSDTAHGFMTAHNDASTRLPTNAG